MKMYSDFDQWRSSLRHSAMQRYYRRANRWCDYRCQEDGIENEVVQEYIWALRVVDLMAGTEAVPEDYVEDDDIPFPEKLRAKIKAGRTATERGRLLPERYKNYFPFEII